MFLLQNLGLFPGLSVGHSEDGDRSWSTGRGSHCRAGRSCWQHLVTKPVLVYSRREVCLPPLGL